MENTLARPASPAEVADFLGTTEVRLAKMRMAGQGPRFIKDGRRVLYRWADVEQYLDANTHTTTAN